MIYIVYIKSSRNHIKMSLFYDFCLGLCKDQESRDVLSRVSDMPEDICHHILNDFSTSVLSKKIHPIQEDDIIMASHKSYMDFVRRNRTPKGAARNEQRLMTIRRMYDRSLKLYPCGIVLFDIIESHLNFPPSQEFMKKLL